MDLFFRPVSVRFQYLIFKKCLSLHFFTRVLVTAKNRSWHKPRTAPQPQPGHPQSSKSLFFFSVCVCVFSMFSPQTLEDYSRPVTTSLWFGPGCPTGRPRRPAYGSWNPSASQSPGRRWRVRTLSREYRLRCGSGRVSILSTLCGILGCSGTWPWGTHCQNGCRSLPPPYVGGQERIVRGRRPSPPRVLLEVEWSLINKKKNENKAIEWLFFFFSVNTSQWFK